MVAVGTKMVEIVNISRTGSYIDARRNLFFFQREISSFLTSRPRYYDEFLIIYAVFFSFRFVKNNYNNYIVVRSSAELNKKC